jgi:hypothetical protein
MSSILSLVGPYIPQQQGLLPKWLLVISLVASLNSVQAYLTPEISKRVYARAPEQVTGLSARTFGTWTFISSVIRFYGAYHIANPQIYQLVFWSYAVAFGHFALEWLVFGSAKWGKGLAGPAFVSTGTLIWMWLQWGFYVQ